MNKNKNEIIIKNKEKKHGRILKAIYGYLHIFNKCNIAINKHTNKHKIE